MYERIYQRRKENGELVGSGFYLDDPADWDLVAKIPSDIKVDTIRMFNAGFQWQHATQAISKEYGADHAWIPEFMAMFHESYVK